MSNLAECVIGRIDELNNKFKDIILSSRDMFAGIPFVPLEHKDASMKCTTIFKDIEFEPSFEMCLKFRPDTFMSVFNDSVHGISRYFQMTLTTGSGVPPETESLRSISIANKLDVQMQRGSDQLSSANYLVEKSTAIAGRTDFVVMSKWTLRRCGFSVPTEGTLHIQGAEVFINPHAGDSVYAGKWAIDGKDGMAVIYPKNTLTCIELIEPESEEPVVRLKAYLNLAMFGENNIFRMDGF